MNSSSLAWLKQLLREGLSWAAFLWGISFGVLATVLFAALNVTWDGTTEWSRVFSFGLLGVGSLLPSILALRSRRQAAWVLIVLAPVIGSCFAWWQRLERYNGLFSFRKAVLVFTGTAALAVLPGLFWLITSRWEWQPLVGARNTPARQPLVLNAALLVFLVFGCAVASLCFPTFEYGCNGVLPPVSVQSSPRQAVFIGKVLFLPRLHSHPEDDFSWAVMRVDHVYWGLPLWMRKIVLVRGYFRGTDDGQQYFVDAHRSQGALTRFLPVVEHYPCCHTILLNYADVDLRVLRDGPPKSGGRIIGRLWRLRTPPGRPNYSESVANATVMLAGPMGEVSTTTGTDGIFDFRDLPPGHYSISVGSYELGTKDLKAGEVWGGSLWLRGAAAHQD
jgi:hypothetical protein